MATFKDLLLSLPPVADWPQMAGIFTRMGEVVRLDWELPALACQAVGGARDLAATGVAAIACLQISIILADDILDDDPRGEHMKIGAGPAANLALAYQAAAFALIDRAPVTADQKAAAQVALARMALTTAYGQHLDVQNLPGEENYWKVVKAKSTPFYGAALQVGALLAGATPTVVQGLYDLGVLVGEITQLNDDLEDALKTPANPDWHKAGNGNLAILYASHADHPGRTRFHEHLALADDPQHLEAAQQILIDSGAVSFCVYQIAQRYQAAWDLLGGLNLAAPQALHLVLEAQARPVTGLLEALGIPLPPELRLGSQA